MITVGVKGLNINQVPSEARVEVDDDAWVDSLTDEDRLLGWCRSSIVSEVAVLLNPAERLSTSGIILASRQVERVLLSDWQRDLTICSVLQQSNQPQTGSVRLRE